MKPKHVYHALYFAFIIVLTKERSANILLQGNEAKIYDFGISKDLYDDKTNPGYFYPFRYSAPEMVTGKTSGTFSTDVWSYGTLIYEVLTYGQKPFQQFKTNEEVSEKFSCDYFSLYHRIDDSFTPICNLDP